MKQYQYEQWKRMVGDADSYLNCDVPLIEDEVIAIIDKEYDEMYHFIRYIANDYFELSHEKVRIQRDDYVRMARDIINRFSEYE